MRDDDYNTQRTPIPGQPGDYLEIRWHRSQGQPQPTPQPRQTSSDAGFVLPVLTVVAAIVAIAVAGGS